MIALMPMKGHSERIPMKNIKPLNGRPLFYFIADTLRDTLLFDSLVINTDSPEIAKLAQSRYGSWVQIFVRPQELCGDHVPMNLILKHDIELLGLDNHYFQTHSTSPFLSSQTIVSAVKKYYTLKDEGTFDSIFSVNLLQTRLYDENLVPINHDPDRLVRTQDLDLIFEENSNFYIFSGKSFVLRNNRIGMNPNPFVMNRNRFESLDIDTKVDWLFAEKIVSMDVFNE